MKYLRSFICYDIDKNLMKIESVQNSDLVDYFCDIEDYDASVKIEMFSFGEFYVRQSLVNHKLFFRGFWFDIMVNYYGMTDLLFHARMMESRDKHYSITGKLARKVYKDSYNDIHSIRLILPNAWSSKTPSREIISAKKKFSEECLLISLRLQKVCEYKMIDSHFYTNRDYDMVGELFFFKENK